MAIRNTADAAAGLSLSSGLQALTDTALTGICSIEGANAGGEAFIFKLRDGSGKYVGLTYDVNAGPLVAIRLSWDGGWEEISSGLTGLDQWFAWGIDSAGVGANGVTVMLSTSSGATPLSFTRTLGGATWTPTALLLMHDATLSRGIRGKIQNVKYGDRGLTAAKMHAEAWSLTNQNGSDWTPVITEMVTGDLTAQRETFTAVNGGNLEVAAGYFVDTGGTTATITVATAVISGDSLQVDGTITSDAESQAVTVELIKSGVIVLTATATLAALAWSCPIDNIPAGVYTVRGRVVDGLGSATGDFASTVEFIGLSGEDSIPYLYTTTALLAVPNSLSLPANGAATVKAVDQSGAAVSGAIASVLSTSIATAPALTDLSGNLVLTGVAAGTTSLVMQITGLSGQLLTVTVPVTITGASVSVVTVSPGVATVQVDQTQQFTSIITGGGSTTWTVESGGGSIDSEGLYTAPSTATVAVIRGAKTGELTSYDESTVTVTAEAQSSIGGQFLGDGDLAVAPGQSFSWRIKITVDGQSFAGAVITPVAVPDGILNITQPLPTSNDGTTTISASVVADTATDLPIAVAFSVVAGDLAMTLYSTVTVVDSPYGYVLVRGRQYPRPYPQNT